MTAHPPFLATEFWQKTMAMIRLHNGYIAPSELEQSLGLKLTPITIAYESRASRELWARTDSYFSVFYNVTGPRYQGVQSGVIPNGQSSSLTIEIPSFSFLSKSGDFECLTTPPVEADLLQAGWTTTSSRQGLFGQSQTKTFALKGKESIISVDEKTQ